MTEKAAVHIIIKKVTHLTIIKRTFNYKTQYQKSDLAQHAF